MCQENSNICLRRRRRCSEVTVFVVFVFARLLDEGGMQK